MRITLAFVMIMCLAGTVAGAELGNRVPLKSGDHVLRNPIYDGREGGDTIATAFVIPCLPYTDIGTTVGYANDYDEVCPYSNGTAPDVVYMFTAASGIAVNIDLCGSGYDTKLYVYDEGLNLIACNDDFYSGPPCGNYVSKIENLLVPAGATYYFVVDGYGTASGDYILDVDCFGCGLEPLVCPAGGVPEGEPALVPDHVDSFNGGCNSPPDNPFQELRGNANGELVFCGVSGWYTYNGDDYRDTDWFRVVMGPGGTIEVAAEAQIPTYIFELGPQDCAAVSVVQQITAVFGDPSTMSISGYQPGQDVWVWAGPTVGAPTPCQDAEYDYVIWFSGLEPGPIATEPTSWSTVKALYR